MSIFGISSKNPEQKAAIEALLNVDIDLVVLDGLAGSGKTLLSLAAGLYQVLDKRLYDKIIVTREVVPIGRQIGFLPGTEDEKMLPWMGAITDNLELLIGTRNHDQWGKEASFDFIKNRLEIAHLAFMRGRTFNNKYIIIDEAQNLTKDQVKILLTRSGNNTKVVVIGDQYQIDIGQNKESNGFKFLLDVVTNYHRGIKIELPKGERSELATFMAEVN